MSRDSSWRAWSSRPGRVALLCGLLCASPWVLQARGPQQAPAAPGVAQCQEAVPDLYRRVSPAVVAIAAMSINPYDTESRMDRVSGSGFIIDTDGSFSPTRTSCSAGR
jgi:hypothetical protein